MEKDDIAEWAIYPATLDRYDKRDYPILGQPDWEFLVKEEDRAKYLPRVYVPFRGPAFLNGKVTSTFYVWKSSFTDEYYSCDFYYLVSKGQDRPFDLFLYDLNDPVLAGYKDSFENEDDLSKYVIDHWERTTELAALGLTSTTDSGTLLGRQRRVHHESVQHFSTVSDTASLHHAP